MFPQKWGKSLNQLSTILKQGFPRFPQPRGTSEDSMARASGAVKVCWARVWKALAVPVAQITEQSAKCPRQHSKFCMLNRVSASGKTRSLLCRDQQEILRHSEKQSTKQNLHSKGTKDCVTFLMHFCLCLSFLAQVCWDRCLLRNCLRKKPFLVERDGITKTKNKH